MTDPNTPPSMGSSDPQQDSGVSRPAYVRPAIITAVIVLIGAAALYGTRDGGNGADKVCEASQAVAERIKPLAKGELAALQIESKPWSAAELAFQGPDGQSQKLDAFRGRTVVFNLWATWCVPCRKEMPALDKLQAQLGAADFEVVAVNMDSRNLDKPRGWMQENGVTHLGYHSDPEGKVFQALRARGRATGLPTTLIVDGKGCAVAHLDGPAEWASEDAMTLVKAAAKL